MLNLLKELNEVMMSGYYILEGKEPKPVSLMDWALSYEKGNAHVGDDTIKGVRISTVFLGLEHGEDESGRPILFETMVFGGPMDGDGERYCTWDEAEAGHKKWCADVIENGLEPEKAKP